MAPKDHEWSVRHPGWARRLAQDVLEIRDKTHVEGSIADLVTSMNAATVFVSAEGWPVEMISSR